MVDSSDHQLAILQLAKEEGIDPANMSPAIYRRLSIKVRNAKEVMRDATSAIISRGKTALHIHVVSDEKAAKNRKICESNMCGKYRVLKDMSTGKIVPACDACNCSGKFLESKWKDGDQACPKGLWSNREEPTEQVARPPFEVRASRAQDGHRSLPG